MDQKALLNLDYIDRIEDRSTPSIEFMGKDMGMTRMRIFFKNGRELSVVRGPFSYGGSLGLYEIMVIGKDEKERNLYDKEDDADNVLGFLDAERVRYYIHKIGVMP